MGYETPIEVLRRSLPNVDIQIVAQDVEHDSITVKLVLEDLFQKAEWIE